MVFVICIVFYLRSLFAPWFIIILTDWVVFPLDRRYEHSSEYHTPLRTETRDLNVRCVTLEYLALSLDHCDLVLFQWILWTVVGFCVAMSEPASSYLCLTAMIRAMCPVDSNVYLSDGSIIPIAYNQNHYSSFPRSWPPTRQNSILEVASDLSDYSTDQQDCFSSGESCMSLDTASLSGNEDEQASILLRSILDRFSEPEPPFMVTHYNLWEHETISPTVLADDWSASQSEFPPFDPQPDVEDDWLRYLLLYADRQRAASPVGSLVNNYDSSDESVASSVISSHRAWTGSPSILTRHVGGCFLELSPRFHPPSYV